MITTSTRRTALALTAALTLTATGISGAAEYDGDTVVGTSITSGSRILYVDDLTGATLDGVSLDPGTPSPFVVRVVDTDLGLSDGPEGFHVTSQMNNLYRTTDGGATHNYVDAPIPSSAVAVDYAAVAVDTLGNMLDLEPAGLVELTGADCDTLLGVQSTVICPLVEALLTGAPGPAPINAGTVEDLDLAALADELLPVALNPAALSVGPYTDPNCSIGIGDGQCDDSTGITDNILLRGTAITNVDGVLPPTLTELLGLLTPEVSGALGAVGTQAILQSLQDDPDYAALANQLFLLEDADVLDAFDLDAVVDGLFDIVPADVTVEDIVGLAGSYYSFPRLTVTPPPGTPSGAYEGTLVITLVGD